MNPHRIFLRGGLCAGLATITTLFALAACGGGGSSDSPAPPPPPSGPTLTVAADADTTVASGNAIALHATQTHSTSTPSWSLSGPGSLSAANGTDVRYLPPDAESDDAAASVTVTVTADGLTKTVTLTLAPANIAGHHWDSARASTTPWRAVAFGNGQFVAVGDNGGISTSTDGQHWTAHDTDESHGWISVTFVGTHWVALASDATVATSTDGATWTVVSGALVSAPGLRLQMLPLVTGNGLIVATAWDTNLGDGQTWVSTDGLTWSSTLHGFSSLAYGAGVFLGSHDRQAYASIDGLNWTARGSQLLELSSFTFAQGEFGSVSGSTFYTSPDGTTWSSEGSTSAPFAQVQSTGDSFWMSDSFVPLDGAPRADISIWSDAHRSFVSTPVTALSSQATGLAAGASATVAVSSDGSTTAGADLGHLAAVTGPSYGSLSLSGSTSGRLMVVSNGGDLLSSVDGKAWSHNRLSGPNWAIDGTNFWASAIGQDDQGTVLVGGIASNYALGTYPCDVFSTTDGTTWKLETLPMDITGVKAIVSDGKRFVALGTRGKVMARDVVGSWSDTGTIAAASGQYGNTMAYGAGRYVVVGTGGLVATSSDAVTWSVGAVLDDGQPTHAALDLLALVYDGARFVAVGSGGIVATSVDGLSWTVSSSATTEGLYALDVSPTGEYVAVGDRGVIETSADRVHWTLRDAGMLRDLRTVHWSNGSFLAAGMDGAIFTSAR